MKTVCVWRKAGRVKFSNGSLPGEACFQSLSDVPPSSLGRRAFSLFLSGGKLTKGGWEKRPSLPLPSPSSHPVFASKVMMWPPGVTSTSAWAPQSHSSLWTVCGFPSILNYVRFMSLPLIFYSRLWALRVLTKIKWHLVHKYLVTKLMFAPARNRKPWLQCPHQSGMYDLIWQDVPKKVGQLWVWRIWQVSNLYGDQGSSSSSSAIFSRTLSVMVVRVPAGFQASHSKQHPEVKGPPFSCALFSCAQIFLRSPPPNPSKLPLMSPWPEFARPETISWGMAHCDWLVD